jgi:hypothetical protein
MEDEHYVLIDDMEPLLKLIDKMGWTMYCQEGKDDTVIGMIIGDEAFVEYASKDCHE